MTIQTYRPPAGARGTARQTYDLRNSERPLAGPFNSPSRFRFRPPHRLTFGLHLRPPGRASIYLRSVLGARGNLEALDPSGKAVNASLRRKTALFAANDFSTFPQCLWERLWTGERVDSPSSNLT